MADTPGLGPDLGPDVAPFPNTRRRFSASAPESNRQNPAIDTNANNTSSDVDTCRICRGEGTRAEPLFYPCKCSGSIKYVHQDCLMEWLSHSQKKHCELCKTPFRFTKLYAPNMPKTLPFHVFVTHVAQYLLRNMLVWLRGALVFSVWLCWLPFLMRSVWSFLFWISDEGFSRNALLFGSDNRGTPNETGSLTTLSSRDDAGYCSSTPLLPITTCWAFTPLADRLSLESVPRLVRALYAINITPADRPYAAFLRLVFGSTGAKDSVAAAGDAAASATTSPPTLLSNVGFLKSLTRHPGLNRVVIATLEGQIITILVVVCFILIILVRDYVVQQQPEIIMRAAAFAADENEVPAQGPAAPQADDPVAHVDQQVEDLVRALREDRNPNMDGGFDDAPWSPLNPGLLREEVGEMGSIHSERSESPEGPAPYDVFTNPGASGSQQASEPEPKLPEHDLEDVTNEEQATVQEFMRIYRAADGDPDRIIELAKEQNLQDKLDWWIKLTRNKLDQLNGQDMVKRYPDSQVAVLARTGEGSLEGRVAAMNAERLRSDQLEEDGMSQEDKGKSRADDGGLDSSFIPGTPARPRANTDGPKVSTTVNPLANNSWSFAELPANETSSGPEPNSSDGPQAEASTGQTSVPGGPAPSDIGDAGDGVFGNGPPSDVPVATLPDNPHFDFNTPPAVNTPPPVQARVPPRPPPGDLIGRIANFMWGEVEAIDPAELAPLHVPDGLHDHGDPDRDGEVVEGVFVDPALGGADMVDDDDERDREVIEAAFAAGLDPDAIEDAEDLEGILELLGMRGPIAGLFQNAIFCAFLVSVTLLLGVFIPYNLGRIAVWTLANPMRIVRILFSISKFVQDMAVIVFGVVAGCTSYALLGWWKLLSLGQSSLPPFVDTAVETSWNMSRKAGARVVNSFMTEMPILSANEMRNFSALSHDALLTLKGYIALAFWAVGHGLELLSGGDEHTSVSEGISWLLHLSAATRDVIKELPHTLSDPTSWVINLSLPEAVESVNPDLAYWGGMDRFWAILCGYVAFSMIAALYLRRGVPFSSGPTMQELEHSILDGLKQASGVMKVILIIGIEMLVFPLYCGLLLDVALLPLFEDTTLKSRLLFTYNYPLTSMFVHWFVGTGYMFHFALFVSMCRKIMRKGVLYFIRDPDDPEFHPVRDVLERNVTTQLRKILFSAFVYGALVIVCLGSVVWGLSYVPDVLPIHYSSNEPVLEFPIDLLFYNFLMPLAVKYFKPSWGLHVMYTWWFRKCAGMLRLTWFLFGIRHVEEEGKLVLREDSPYQELPWYRKLFLEVRLVKGKDPFVLPQSWKTLSGGFPPTPPVASLNTPETLAALEKYKDKLVASGQLIPDGRHVRAPASDQIKIPKGKPVFLDVTVRNERLDGKPDVPETDIYSTRQYQIVYIPPFFRARVCLLIVLIWAFAAVTGVGITIVPLVFGRAMFKLLIPAHIRTNDIYAFSIGIHVLGPLTYFVLHARCCILPDAVAWFARTFDSVSIRDAATRATRLGVKGARLLYAYFFLLLVFPVMVVTLLELYCLIPLNTWMYGAAFSSNLPLPSSSDEPGVAAAASVVNINPRHTVRVIQSWTIGVLVLKLAARFVSAYYEGTRLSAAVRAVLRRGWLDPDVAVLTRAFVIPGTVLFSLLVSAPLLVGRALLAYGVREGIISYWVQLMTSASNTPAGMPIDLDAAATAATNVVATGEMETQLRDAVDVLVYRMSYPLTALAVGCARSALGLVDVFKGWKVRIRDEAYLIGERLHNLGTTSASANGAGRGAWRAGGGGRL